ncbi:MAG: hypothetical protein AAF333_13105 [Planctomycetota bacterium]
MERLRPRSVRGGIAASALLAVAATTLGGCATSSQPTDAERAAAVNAWTLGPLVDDDGSYRSLSLDSPEMAELLEIQPWLTMGEPWYAGRVDRARQVTAGVKFTIVEKAFVAEKDRFDSNNGQVQDNFKSVITSKRLIEVVR